MGVTARNICFLLLLLGAIWIMGCLGSESAPVKNTSLQNSEATGNGNLSQFLTDNQIEQPNILVMEPENGTDRLGAPNQNKPNLNSSPNDPAIPLVINTQNALKISMLRKGDTVSFGRSQVHLDNIYFNNSPIAQYELLDQDGNFVKRLELGQNQTFQFSGPDKIDYVVRTVFVVGEGMPNGVQTQIYRAMDLNAMPWAADIGRPLGAYSLRLEYPAPKLMDNKSLGVGDIMTGGEIAVQLTEIDRSGDAPVARLRIMDASRAGLGMTGLMGQQMADVRMPSGERYSVVVSDLPKDQQVATVAIYQTQVFRNQTVGGGQNAG